MREREVIPFAAAAARVSIEGAGSRAQRRVHAYSGVWCVCLPVAAAAAAAALRTREGQSGAQSAFPSRGVLCSLSCPHCAVCIILYIAECVCVCRRYISLTRVNASVSCQWALVCTYIPIS